MGVGMLGVFIIVGVIIGSTYLIGGMLGRFGEALVGYPGGCDFGVRPIDQHIKGWEALGTKVDIAHGKMGGNELEAIMQDFIDKKSNVLVCTTILESGIDIPNANTIIVENADRLGLAQLYQIRGRVGRGERIAYAYLMYKPSKVLTDTAVKRLKSIKDFTELGSGYRIAMRDLSIRGAGDLLGSEQAGFVDTVGIELYMQMIEEEMRRMKGEVVEEDEEETTSSKSLVEVETHISDDYVSDEDIKIEIHKKINEIDGYKKLLEIKHELEDRFGKISKTLEIYMFEEWFEKQAKELKAQLKKAMEDNNIKSWETPNGTKITLIPDAEDKEVMKFNEEKFKEENEETYNKYLESKIQKGKSGYVKVTL